MADGPAYKHVGLQPAGMVLVGPCLPPDAHRNTPNASAHLPEANGKSKTVIHPHHVGPLCPPASLFAPLAFCKIACYSVLDAIY
jgi:hypothetical protein